MTLNKMFLRAGLTMSGVVLALAACGAAPAFATTLTIVPTTWAYYDPYNTGTYQTLDYYYGSMTNAMYKPHDAWVGFQNYPQESDYGPLDYGNGHYAATVEFTLPVLPDHAVVNSATFTFQPTYGFDPPEPKAGDVEIRAYQAADIACDASRVGRGSLWDTLHLGAAGPGQTLPPTSLDMTGLWTFHLAEGGDVLGFSFVQVADSCTTLPQPYPQCTATIGDSANPGLSTNPTLTISYDLAPVVSTVPLPAAAPMFGAAMLGLGGLG